MTAGGSCGVAVGSRDQICVKPGALHDANVRHGLFKALILLLAGH